jgi:hypothetical protein
MLSVLCLTNFIATDRGTLARSRLRTAVRRKSCGISPTMPAFSVAAYHDFPYSTIGFPLWWNTRGMRSHPAAGG